MENQRKDYIYVVGTYEWGATDNPVSVYNPKILTQEELLQSDYFQGVQSDFNEILGDENRAWLAKIASGKESLENYEAWKAAETDDMIKFAQAQLQNNNEIYPYLASFDNSEAAEKDFNEILDNGKAELLADLRLTEYSIETEIDGFEGTWLIVDLEKINNTNYFLLQHNEFDDMDKLIVNNKAQVVISTNRPDFEDLHTYLNDLENEVSQEYESEHDKEKEAWKKIDQDFENDNAQTEKDSPKFSITEQKNSLDFQLEHERKEFENDFQQKYNSDIKTVYKKYVEYRKNIDENNKNKENPHQKTDCGEEDIRKDFSKFAGLNREISFRDMLKFEQDYDSDVMHEKTQQHLKNKKKLERAKQHKEWKKTFKNYQNMHKSKVHEKHKPVQQKANKLNKPKGFSM